MARFKIVTPAAPSGAGGNYAPEMEALGRIDAAIVEVAGRPEEQFIEAAKDADALYAKVIPITARIIDQLTRCRAIALGSVGVDSVDIEAATRKGIPVTNVPDTFIEEVADHAMTLLLAIARRLVVQDRLVRDGRWSEGRPMLYQYPRLMGQTLGLISFGRVARAVAMRAKPFGLRIMAHDPYVEELTMSRYGVEPVGFDELLENADFISMHAPGRSEVFHMLGREQFDRMKPTALFINTGRGSTVDENALIEALRSGRIAGAALDVLEVEPAVRDNPLLAMDNVILTAHVASASSRFDPVRRRRVGHELALMLQGRWPMSCVNPTVLDRTDLTRWQPHSIERGPNS